MRKAAVAGQFYSADKDRLAMSVAESFRGRLGPGRLPDVATDGPANVVGLVVPHAGYMKSGSAAAWGYCAMAEDGMPDVAVILGPNHYGIGASVALSPHKSWQPPLGIAQCDAELAGKIQQRSAEMQFDEAAHSKEHSIEVQLPFLQYLRADVRIVPISLMHRPKLAAHELAESLGHAIAQAAADANANIAIIASSDFSHYETKASAAAKDAAAIEHILAMDSAGLIDEVYDRDITMCGVVGVAVMLEACKAMGAKKAEKLAYYSSGEVTGDNREVVGYAAVTVRREEKG